MAKGLKLMSTKELTRLEIIQKVDSRSLKQATAAELLNVSPRQIRRLLKAYRKDGVDGLISKRRGHSSNNRLSQSLQNEAMQLIKKYYIDFGPTLAHEKLTEQHQLKLSVESLRQLMIREEIWQSKKKKSSKNYQMRTRRSKYGDLVQIDGSPHDWFEGRAPKCTLLVFVDDATGKLMQLYFEPEESTHGYMTATRHYLEKHGLPLAFYSDRHGIFRVNTKEAKTGTGETQFSRAMRELDITLINANSPQAKGRVERANGVLQDRLVKELRLKSISDIVTANQFLPEFVEDYNRRFSVAPVSPVDAHRQTIPNSKTLDLILSQRHQRTITKNLEVHYKNIIYQIQTESKSYTMRGGKVEISDNDGNVTLIYKNHELNYKVYKKDQRATPIATSKQLNQQIEKIKKKPSADHPWRQFKLRNSTKQNALTHNPTGLSG